MSCVDGAIVFDAGRGMGREKEGNKAHKTKPGNRMLSQEECPTKIEWSADVSSFMRLF